MTEPRPVTTTDPATRIRRRAKRGVVASWIHELSERHGSAARAEEAVEAMRTVEGPLEPQSGEALA